MLCIYIYIIIIWLTAMKWYKSFTFWICSEFDLLVFYNMKMGTYLFTARNFSTQNQPGYNCVLSFVTLYEVIVGKYKFKLWTSIGKYSIRLYTFLFKHWKNCKMLTFLYLKLINYYTLCSNLLQILNTCLVIRLRILKCTNKGFGAF